jgi:hypothetical protein
MHARQSSTYRRQRQPRLRRGVWISYLTAGAVLAVSRVALFVWLYRWTVYGEPSRVWWYLVVSFLYAEWFLAGHTPLGDMAAGTTGYFLVWGSLLTVTSFVLATPILLVGWLMRRRQ